MVAVVLSIPYQFTGQTGVEFFSLSAVTGIPLLAIGALVFSFRSYPEKRVTFSIACMGFIYLLSRISIPLSGYADAPLASVVMILLVLLSLHDSRKEASEGRLIILIALVAGLAAITKQLGVLMIVMVPTVVLVREGKPWNREKALKAFVIAAGIATSWYGIKVYDFFTGSDMFGLPGIVSTVQLGIFERIPPALRDLDGYLIPDSIPGVVRVVLYLSLALLIASGALRDVLARWLLTFSVAVAVFWVFVASYDSRNLSLAVPFMALLLGRSVAARVKTAAVPGKFAGVNFKPVYVWTLIALSAGVGQFLLPDEVLKREQKFWHEEWIKNGASFLSPEEIPKP
ncbi:MAG: hypothetical protein EBX52_13785 [Proteobacteria bacterium]|nr:hypothetical protein [Pseudomonadota bacterium]